MSTVIGLLQKVEGASLTELTADIGWMEHPTRAAMTACANAPTSWRLIDQILHEARSIAFWRPVTPAALIVRDAPSPQSSSTAAGRWRDPTDGPAAVLGRATQVARHIPQRDPAPTEGYDSINHPIGASVA
ncbi:DUF3489 domain-containing protein [Microvirga antarctica]|uniref:DUF3489 domain-containing protein n=1 Tax=Microvirga antarctica TaxID=2819233 RepID=UPI001B30ADA2